MKKVYYSLMALSLITASCSENNSVINEEVGLNAISSVNATLENADTRADFTSETTIAWETYDNITVFSDTKKKPTTFFKAEKEDKVVFYGNEVKGNTFYAIYPQINNNNNGYIDPAVKGLVHVMFEPRDNSGDGTKPGNNNIFMAAKSTNNDFTFKQTYGVIRLALTGSMRVNDINLMSNNQEKISGEATIDLTADEPVLVIDSQSQYAYTYKVVSVYETMDPGTTHYVYFKLPPTNFTKGFTVSIHCQDPNTGEGYSINKTTSTPVEIKRGMIKAYNAINLDEELEKIEQEKAAEKAALQAIYTALKPADATWQGWDFTKEPKSRWDADGWQGLIVEDGHVVELQLAHYDGMNVSGAMPAEIGNLKHLRALWIQSRWDDNYSITSLPDELANIKTLKQIVLEYQNGLTVFPAVIGNMTQLEELIITNLPITTFPAAILQLTNLKHLTVQSCQMTGEFPIGVMNLPNLTNLTLGGNQFTGELTAAFFTNWPAMTDLALGGSNGLTGNVSREVIQGPNWPAFENIDIGGTAITLEGAVKSFDVNADKEYEWGEKQRIKTLSVNEEFQIEVSNFKPVDADNKEVAYKNGDPNVVSVDANGKVKALRQGDTRVKIIAKDHCGAWMEIHFFVQ